MHPVRVIVGLGNPGSAYDGTRHNVGFYLLDNLLAKVGGEWKKDDEHCAHTATIRLGGKQLLLAKPQTYMNLSGKTVQSICRKLKLSPAQVVVVYDELQIPLGRAKLSVKGRAGGHNGIQDIIDRLGECFIRYRIGIGSLEPTTLSMADFVLGKFTESEQLAVKESLSRRIDDIQSIVRLGPELAMNQINQR